MKQRVLDAAKQEASPTRAQHRTKAIRSLVIAIAIALFILFATGGPELGHRPAILLASTALILAGLAIAITLLATRGFGTSGSNSMTGAPTDILIGAAIFSAPVLWLVELGGRLIWIPTVVRPASLVSTSICHVCTLAMAAAPLYVMIRLRRHTDAIHPRATGAALGAAAGAWGAVLIDLHCASNNMLHIAVGHILPTVVLAIVGAVLGAKSLALPKAI